MKSVLTIAGFDPSSGAGVTADLMVFAAHGLFGTSCITSLTVQSTVGVRSASAMDPKLVEETLQCLEEDLPPAGIKIGMLKTAAIVTVVVDFLERLRATRPGIPVVLDPVLRSSSGRELLDPEGVALLKKRLLPLVDWVTPNLDELDVLTGHDVKRRQQMPVAAKALQQMGNGLNVMATGGHLQRPDDFVLTAAGEAFWLEGVEVNSSSTHGTGCALSTALLSRLVLGETAAAAGRAAKNYVTTAIQRAEPLGHGHGPLNHLWPLRPVQD